MHRAGIADSVVAIVTASSAPTAAQDDASSGVDSTTAACSLRSMASHPVASAAGAAVGTAPRLEREPARRHMRNHSKKSMWREI